MMTVTQTARKYGVSSARVRQCIDAGQVLAVRIGPIWLIDDKEGQRWALMRRPAGRPKLNKGKRRG